ncbi:AbrB/MazE/SpoVT family DNA-binding domain-containing protein [Halolactibacillus sp. JCM 19043]|uniref:AbrB/MazE/SpoVT family DNA-binding domain-containing protein n=1 Tax=Halolactibacillus sp. JCM 19043 TaxID=1460638 RepID=UPI0007837A6D|nr:AbrB/MazE/SpoVT family DNA-binding domain-containing protein [Halolactibacillus sp. JCM 19043]
MGQLKANQKQIDRKIIRVSNKRQITIPLKYFEKLQLGQEIECVLEDNQIVLKPVQDQTFNYSVEILKELVAEGYEGTDLIYAFKNKSNQINQAVETLIDEAEAIGRGDKQGASFNDIFSMDDD